MKIRRVEPRLVKQTDQVDIRRIVELMRAHLAHGKRHHPPRRRDVILGLARQFLAPDLIGDRRLERKIAGQIREIGERSSYLLKLPNPRQIGQSRHKRNPPLTPPQLHAQLVRGNLPERRI